jgi:hypothetical protein
MGVPCARCKRAIGDFDDKYESHYYGSLCCDCVLPALETECAENYTYRERIAHLEKSAIWRNAKTDPPKEPTVCLVVLGDNQYVDVTTWAPDAPWWTGIIKYWRPIGDLPEVANG